MASNTPAIVTKALTKTYGTRRVADTIDLQIGQGTVFGFLGPNGAGKTTTIRMLLGLIQPTSGSGQILGHDIQRERAAILPQIGALVESPAFYPYLSGYDNLRVLVQTSGKPDYPRIAEVLELVGLSNRARDTIRTYSLGMKQRLAIAATLLNRPKIVFLDEPTNGLDPAGTVEVRELIKQLGSTGHTIFLSSHLLHEVEQICTEVAIINHGKLMAQGHVADLLQTSETILVEAEPLPLVQAVADRMGVAVQICGPRTARLTMQAAQAPVLSSALIHAGAALHQLTPQRSTLEQFFLELTGTLQPEKGAV
jgi:ABC-2 type transport system ATP-binding protein